MVPRCGGGPPDANTIEYTYDGISITYGSPGKRQHLFTYTAGLLYKLPELRACSCPCVLGGRAPPTLVGSDYYCESGNPAPSWDFTSFYNADPLWDGQQGVRAAVQQTSLGFACKMQDAPCMLQSPVTWK